MSTTRRTLAILMAMVMLIAAGTAYAAAPADGSYTDFGSGRNDFIYVTTTFKDGKIASVPPTQPSTHFLVLKSASGNPT